jgi:S-phase kinase-associated protein 1
MSIENKNEKLINNDTEEVLGLDMDDDDDTPDMITLHVVSDGTKFEVNKKYALISTTIVEAISDTKSHHSTGNEITFRSGETTIEIRGNITGEIMAHVVEYMNHHKGVEPPIIPKPAKSNKMIELCEDKWDADYINNIGKKRQVLYDVMSAANHLTMNVLLHLGCAKVGVMIKGQPLDSLKGILDPKINNDPVEDVVPKK